MSPVRLGAVGYLNARPLVFGLDRSPRFTLACDVPAECARLLQTGAIDLGLIPSIEYLHADAYRMVPSVAIASRGSVASVALYTTKPMREVQSIALDASSRTSAALVRILCRRVFAIDPVFTVLPPDLGDMLAGADAALVIGDNALLWDGSGLASAAGGALAVEKIDLGECWTRATGLPFVWAFWAGRPGAVGGEDVDALLAARDVGVANAERIAREYFRDRPQHQEAGVRYLRDNIRHELGADERVGLETFYRYAAEAGLTADAGALRFY